MNSTQSSSGAQRAPQPTTRPRLVEVELKRKYCPHYLIQEDGTALPNEGHPLQTLQPQKLKLHHEDAAHALQHGIAMPTRNTYRDV